MPSSTGFTETGGGGADLTVLHGKSDHTFAHRRCEVGDAAGRRGSGVEHRLPLPVRQQPVALRGLLPEQPGLLVRHHLGEPEAGHGPRRAVDWRQTRTGRPADRLRGRVQQRHHQPRRQLQVRPAAGWPRGSAAATAGGSCASASAVRRHHRHHRRHRRRRWSAESAGSKFRPETVLHALQHDDGTTDVRFGSKTDIRGIAEIWALRTNSCLRRACGARPRFPPPSTKLMIGDQKIGSIDRVESPRLRRHAVPNCSRSASSSKYTLVRSADPRCMELQPKHNQP